MSAEEHTPLPWWIRTHPDLPSYIAAKPTQDHPYHGVTETIELIGDEDYPRKMADMEFIVKAITVHAKLLAALKAISENYGACHCDHTTADCCSKVGEWCPFCIAELAIAEAEKP